MNGNQITRANPAKQRKAYPQFRNGAAEGQELHQRVHSWIDEKGRNVQHIRIARSSGSSGLQHATAKAKDQVAKQHAADFITGRFSQLRHARE